MTTKFQVEPERLPPAWIPLPGVVVAIVLLFPSSFLPSPVHGLKFNLTALPLTGLYLGAMAASLFRWEAARVLAVAVLALYWVAVGVVCFIMLLGPTFFLLNYAFAHLTNPFPPERRRDSDVNPASSQLWIELPQSDPSLYGDIATYHHWARLAQWYPTLYTSAGGFGYEALLGQGKSIDLTRFGQAITPAGQIIPCTPDTQPPSALLTLLEWTNILKAHDETHGFMQVRPFSQVWGAYKALTQVFDPQQ